LLVCKKNKIRRLLEVQSTVKSIVEPLYCFKFMTVVEPVFPKTEQQLVFNAAAKPLNQIE
jgi:hypothetical protein